MADPERILIIGAGGIGAYYGARLQSAGHEVTYVARGEHLDALQANGLTVRHPEFAFAATVDALSLEELLASRQAGSFTLAILTIKAGSTAEVLGRLGPWLGTGSGPPILSLQNGIDNEDQIAAAVGHGRTVGGLAVRIGAHVVDPGVVEATGPAQVVLGAWPTARDNPLAQAPLPALVKTFRAAGIPTALSDDIRLELWKKLMINNGVNPLSVLTELDTRTLSNHPVLGPTVFRIMRETAAAAAADGVRIDPADVEAMYGLIRGFDPIKTSMLVDYEKGRPLELDEIAGVVIERCRRADSAAPLTELVAALLELKLARRER